MGATWTPNETRLAAMFGEIGWMAYCAVKLLRTSTSEASPEDQAVERMLAIIGTVADMGAQYAGGTTIAGGDAYEWLGYDEKFALPEVV